MTSVLVIDDEIGALEILSMHLEKDGYEAMTAASGVEGLRLAYEHQPDAVILDIRMPGMDGREVCARLRDITDAPILIVSVLNNTEEAVRNLELGADDYLTKPVEYAELSARLGAHLRRRDRGTRIIPATGSTGTPWRVDEARREVVIDDRRIQLTPKEFVVFQLFMRHPGEVLSVDRILFEAWGPEYEGDADLVKQFVYRLRSKLEEDSADPKIFVTVRGSGYSFETEAQAMREAALDLIQNSVVSDFRRRARMAAADLQMPVAIRSATLSQAHPTPKHLPKKSRSAHGLVRASDPDPDWPWRLGFWLGRWPKVNTAWLLIPTAVFVLIATGALAQATAAALPGDGTYPVKLLVEQAQLFTAIDISRSLELRLEFVQRRMGEIAELAASGRTTEIPDAVQRLQDGVEQTIDSVPREQLAEVSSPALDEGVVELLQLRDQSPTELERAYSGAIEAARVLQSRMLDSGRPENGDRPSGQNDGR